LIIWLIAGLVFDSISKHNNIARKAFLDRFVSNLPILRESNEEELAIRKLIIARFLGSNYGRWFGQTCVRAGKWDRAETTKYVGRKFELAIGALIIAVLCIQLLNASNILLLLLPILGFFWPDYKIYRAGQKRGEEIVRALPETIELLNMTVGAGLGFQAGLDRIARTDRNPLSDDFRRVLTEIRLGDKRAHAFTSMAERIDRPEIWSFTNAILQVEKLGIPISNALRDQAKSMRAERREVAREKAQKLPVKILGPIMVFLLPCVLTIVLAPAIVGIMKVF
jgi:tight adherence protein C